MRGHIQQRGEKSFRIRACAGRDRSGRKRYVQRTIVGTRRDAEKALTRLLGEVDEGRIVASASMTMNELIDKWLAVKRQSVEPSTMINYEWVARKYVRPALGTHKVDALRAMDLDMLYTELSGRGL